MRRILVVLVAMVAAILVGVQPSRAAVASLHGEACGYWTAPDGTEERVCAAVNRHDFTLAVEGWGQVGLTGNCKQVKIQEVKLMWSQPGTDTTLMSTTFNQYRPCGQPATVWTNANWYDYPCATKSFYGRIIGKVQGDNGIWGGLVGKSSAVWVGEPC